MDIAALAISALAAVIAVVGTYLANKRSKEALWESRKATVNALWSDVQEAVQRLVGFDPSAEPVGERVANLRIAGIALADELTDWEGFDEWLEAERVLGAALGRQVMEVAQTSDTVERRLQNLHPLMSWAHALSQNLRLFRRTGYDKKVISELTANATDVTRTIHERYGWELPPTANPRLRPLDK